MKTKKSQSWIPSVIICHEKHGDRIFNALTEEKLYESSLLILKERMKSGYWYHDPGDDKPKEPDYKKDDIPSLKGDVKKLAEQLLNVYNMYYRDWQIDMENYNDITTALKTNDGKFAWRILNDGTGEYERVSLEPIENV